MFAWWVKLLIKTPPVDEPMESDVNLREIERQNIIQLFNYVTHYCLEGKWTSDNPNNVEYKKARRLFYRASFREWAKLLNDAMRSIMWVRPEYPIFYRQVSAGDWQRIEAACQKLTTHPLWMDPNPQVEATLNSNIQREVADLFEREKLNMEFLCTP